MLTGAFLCLPYGGMPEADSLKHPQQFYLTLALQQTVFTRYGNSHIAMNSVSQSIHQKHNQAVSPHNSNNSQRTFHCQRKIIRHIPSFGVNPGERFYPHRQITYTKKSIAIATPVITKASGQIIVKHPPRLSVHFASGTPSPSSIICSPA